ncbi:RidA family protein [Streptomyces sp. NPDC021098]|uniref:RidA family protein n=1 Tax=unclassified Streptomyces TaxID=2593676 RepID=UPI0037A1515B
MSTVERNIQALGLTLSQVATPLAAYVPAIRSGRYIHTSGQLPLVDGALPLTGKVGGDVTPDQAKELARTCVLNALAAVKQVAGDLDRTARVVKVVGYVASAADFAGQPAVVNGASELLGEALGDKGVHARSAVGVAVLPLNAPVEVEIQVELTD